MMLTRGPLWLRHFIIRYSNQKAQTERSMTDIRPIDQQGETSALIMICGGGEEVYGSSYRRQQVVRFPFMQTASCSVFMRYLGQGDVARLLETQSS